MVIDADGTVRLGGGTDGDDVERPETVSARAPSLRTAGAALVVDTSGASFCDSTGLDALLRAGAAARPRGVRRAVPPASPGLPPVPPDRNRPPSRTHGRVPGRTS
ncbi:hypothetical protein GCM10010363_71710 [Streptomyces omiyaensis]|nr:hypothetical protein GCM10010363_71710 [Streptomyces omiyaensis]